MKKIIRRVTATAVATMLAGSAVLTSFAAENDVEKTSSGMQNGYLRIACDNSTGAIRLWTTGGDPDNPNDNNKKLLYERNVPKFGKYSTSMTALSLDGREFEYSSANWQTNLATKSIDSTMSKNNVSIAQSYKFVKSTSTDREDLVEISYTVKNNSNTSKKFGMRIMIDTMLGDNDEAPFRIPGTGAVTTEKQYNGDDIPAYYQAFDDLANPTVVSYGCFDKTSQNKPDYVQFAYWRKQNNDNLENKVDENSLIGDSSVNSIWKVKTLSAGETKVYKMYYGLGSLQTSTGTLDFSGTSEKIATVNDDFTGYNPSSVMAFIKNPSNTDLKNVKVTLNLCDGLNLKNSSDSVTVDVGTLKSGEEKQLSWDVIFDITKKGQKLDYSITATADGIEKQTVDLSTLLPTFEVPTTVEPTTQKPTEIPTTAQPTTAKPTEVPTTIQPTTAKPTEVPTTIQPTTAKPTEIPTTVQPTTAEPTEVPTTVQPTTAEPTEVPTTVQPTTAEPTEVPTTVEPTTAEPSTAPTAPSKPATDDEPKPTAPAPSVPQPSQNPTSAINNDTKEIRTITNTKVIDNTGCVKTGAPQLAATILAVLASAAGMCFAFFKKRRYDD